MRAAITLAAAASSAGVSSGACCGLTRTAVVTPAYGVVDPSSIPVVGFTIVFAGLVVCGVAFLLADFGLRPVAAVALSIYMATVAGYSSYGAIGGIMAVLFALWIINIVIILGAEVDAVAEAGLAAGGTEAGPAQDHGFMYGRSFDDPDGHGWEIMWMDPAAAEAGPEHVGAQG